MVEAEQSTQPNATNDGTSVVRRGRVGIDEHIPDALVVALSVVVGDVLAHDVLEMTMPEGDHMIQALAPERPHEALGVGIQVWTAGRNLDDVDAGGPEQLPKCLREERVAVADEMGLAAQATIEGIDRSAGPVQDPRAAGIVGDAEDRDATRRQVDDEPDKVTNDTEGGQHLGGEEISRRKALPMDAEELGPRHAAPRRRRQTMRLQDARNRRGRHDVAELTHGGEDAFVAPRAILRREPNDESLKVERFRGSTSPTLGAVVVLRGDELPIPTTQGIGGDDGMERLEQLARHPLGFASERTTSRERRRSFSRRTTKRLWMR